MTIQKQNQFIINTSFACSIALFSVVATIFIVNGVPSHYVLRAQIFFSLGIIAILATLIFFVINFRHYLLFAFVMIALLPYFETYLTPVFDNDLLRVFPQLFLILLACVGYAMRPVRHHSVLVNVTIILWIFINFASLLFNKNTAENIPVFLAGVVGPSLFTMILCDMLTNKAKGFSILLNTLWISMGIYLIFSIVTLLIAGAPTSVQDIYLSRFGGEFARGPYGSNALPFYMSLAMPLVIYSLFSPTTIFYGPNWIRIVLIVLVISISFLIISRGAILVSIVYIGLWAWLFIIHIRKNRKGSQLMKLLLLGVVAALLVTPIIPEEYMGLLMGRFGLEKEIKIASVVDEYNQNLRMDIWKNSIEIFKQNYCLGVGLGNIRQEMIQMSGYDYDSHNILLDVFAEQGIFAGLILIFMIVLSIKRAIHLYMQKAHFAGLNMALCLCIVVFIIYGSLLTGGRLISTGLTVSGFGAYFLFMSFALQDYLWRSRKSVSDQIG